MKRAKPGLIVALACWAGASAARAEQSASRAEPSAPTPASAATRSSAAQASALELSALAGPTLTFGEAANPQYQRSTSQVGLILLGSVGYRSSYIVDPALDVGYAALARGEAQLPAGPWGDGGQLQQRLSEWIISPAISADLWRFRPRLGLGVSIVSQANEWQTGTHHATQLSLASQFGLGFRILRTPRARVDVETRLVMARGVDVTFMTLAVSASFEALRFGD